MYLLHNSLYHCSLTKFKLNSNWFTFLYDECVIVFFIVNRLPHILSSVWATALIKTFNSLQLYVFKDAFYFRLNYPVHLFFFVFIWTISHFEVFTKAPLLIPRPILCMIPLPFSG